MPGIDTKIMDAAGKGTGMTVQKGGNLEGPAGAVVYTERRNVPSLIIKPFVNPTYGFDLNQNGAFGGTPVGIHNGTDSVLWTGSVEGGPSSKFDFASTEQAHTGTKSVEAIQSSNGQSAVFTNGSPLDTSGYKAITGWIYLTEWDTSISTLDVTLKLRDGGTVVSSTASIGERIIREQRGVWQKFTITLAELNITDTTIDEVVITTVSPGGDPPDYYLDDLQFEETGEAITFSITPTAGTIFEVVNYGVTIVGAQAGTLADGTMPNIPYNNLLGTTVTSGISSTVTRNNVSTTGGTFFGIADFLTFLPEGRVDGIGSDGTNTWIKINSRIQEFRFDSRTGDSASITISDDLSGLVQFRFAAFGYEYIIGE